MVATSGWKCEPGSPLERHTTSRASGTAVAPTNTQTAIASRGVMGDRQARRRGEGGRDVVVVVMVAVAASVAASVAAPRCVAAPALASESVPAGAAAVALCRLTMASTAEA